MNTLTREEFEDIEISPNETEYLIRHQDRYFKLGLVEGQIFEALYNFEEQEDILNRFKITANDLSSFIQVLRQNGIIGALVKEKKNIFFYRIPLIEVDNVADKVMDFVKKYKTLFFILFVLYNITILAGLPVFISHYTEIVSLNSIKLLPYEYFILYISILISVMLHESAHGLVSKLFGCKIGKIGFILIFFQPAFYCDISGIRMADKKYKQVMACLAGVYMNLFLGSATALIYCRTHYRIAAAFTIIQFTYIFSNLFPFIRLDGYWILSFITGITNLYQKAMKGIHYIWSGHGIKEKFIGLYGLVTYVIIFMSLAGFGMTVWKWAAKGWEMIAGLL